jgi:hypothetical protein
MCSVEGCNNKVHTVKSGLCSKHYNRLRNTGTTDDGPRARIDADSRFLKNIEKTLGCWNWTGAVNAYGYGVITVGGRIGKQWKAHRYSWVYHNGTIPESDGPHGTVVMHKCDNRLCVNPDHLELGSQADNVRDMDNKGRRRNQYG